MLRNVMLRAAASPALVSQMSWLGNQSGLARRFIAGESLGEARPVVDSLHTSGLYTTLDLLGEGVRQETEALRATQAYVELLQTLGDGGVRPSISIKLTQLGLEFDEELCRANLVKILDTASRLDNFVRIDMEGSRYTEPTLRLFRAGLEHAGPGHVGVVIQSYLRRSEKDIRDLCECGCNIRLCKGAYMEPPSVAFPSKRDVDRSFKRLAEIMLRSKGYSAIATHDEKMIRHVCRIVRAERVPTERFEFQMLFGVRRERQLGLRREGYRMRVYVPFGTQWAPYFMRRLAERPANLLFLLRNYLRR